MTAISMSIGNNVRPAEGSACKQAGMVKLVCENNVARAHKAGDHPDIGQIAAAKDNGIFSAFQLGQFAL